MRIIIDQGGLGPDSDVGQGYTRLKDLHFAPETGILGQSAPVNEFSADIATEDDIEIGDYMRLRDDRETLWAQYWLTSARRIDHQTVHVIGKSDLMLLDRPRLPAEFYDGVAVSVIVQEIFDAIGYNFEGTYYTLDATIGARTLTGFCPEQTARERLQWVCFAAGAYIKTYFSANVQILPVPSPAGFGTIIPPERTFWKPRITQTDYVTAVTVRAYRFTQTEPQSGDKYVTDQGGITYVYTTEDITISNPDLQPAQYPVNVISAQDVMLLDTTRASAAASLLAQYYFKRTTVELDVIDNGEYQPGDKVTVYGSENRLYTGFITAAVFAFGLQARATLTVAGAEQTTAATLTIIARYADEVLDVRRYTFPVGYGYSLHNDYIDLTRGDARRVLRPLTDITSGTMPQGGVVIYVDYAAVLILRRGVLEIISVDAVAEDTEEDITIGVIT